MDDARHRQIKVLDWKLDYSAPHRCQVKTQIISVGLEVELLCTTPYPEFHSQAPRYEDEKGDAMVVMENHF